MSEYKVQWRHLRYPTAVDWWWRLEKHNLAPTGQTERAIAKRSLRPAGEWQRGCTHLAQHGGKTECRIYQLCPPLYEATQMPTMRLEVASAEAICSWRDQFDRRVGRLYSLALALHEWDSCAASALVKTQILTDNIPQAGERGNAFYLAFLAHDQVAVKRICAEIVQSWKQR